MPTELDAPLCDGQPDSEILDLTPVEGMRSGGRPNRKRLEMIPVSQIERLYAGHFYLLQAGTEQGIPIERPIVRFGRGEQNDYVYGDERVSRRHFVIASIGRELIAIACTTPANVRLNDQLITQSRIQLDDRLKLPQLKLVLKRSPGPHTNMNYSLYNMSVAQGVNQPLTSLGGVPTLEEPTPDANSTVSYYAVTCYRGPMRGATYTFADARERTLGSDVQCDFRHTDTNVDTSRIRFKPLADGLLLRVEPQGKAIKVNGRLVNTATLHLGNTFAIGRSKFIMHLSL